jgi:hypothetical protein
MWRLKSFRVSYFKRWNICLLHIAPLGLVKLHVVLLGKLYGSEFRAGEFDSILLKFAK